MKPLSTQPASASPVLPMLPRIVSVETDPETWTILATFATGERRRYDVTPLLSRGVFRRIAEPEAFVAVRPDEMGGVCWDAGADLSRDTVYLGGERVNNEGLNNPCKLSRTIPNKQ